MVTLSVIAIPTFLFAFLNAWTSLPRAPETLSFVQLKEIRTRNIDGKLRLDFPDSVEALDGHPVQITGLMAPFTPGDDYDTFRLLPTDTACRFCGVPNRAQVILINNKQQRGGMDFMGSPIKVTGTFHLKPSGSDQGLLYAIDAAKIQPLLSTDLIRGTPVHSVPNLSTATYRATTGTYVFSEENVPARCAQCAALGVGK